MSGVIKTEISIKEKEKKKKLLREVTVKIEFKQQDDEDGITMKVLLDSKVTGLVMSLEFVRNKFKKKAGKTDIYIRNVDSIFNHKRLIEHTVEIKLFYRGHKKRMEINVIGEQK